MEGIWTLTYIYSLCVLLLVAVQSKTHVEMVVQLDLFILQLFAPKNVPWITCCLLQLRPSNTSSPITSSPFSTFWNCPVLLYGSFHQKAAECKCGTEKLMTKLPLAPLGSQARFTSCCLLRNQRRQIEEGRLYTQDSDTDNPQFWVCWGLVVVFLQWNKQYPKAWCSNRYYSSSLMLFQVAGRWILQACFHLANPVLVFKAWKFR